MKLVNRLLIFPAAISLCAGGLCAAELPKPFTPIKATAKEFRCLNRKIDLGNFLLPMQIIAADKPLLSAPIQIISEPDVFSTAKGRVKILEKNSQRARWEWNGESVEFLIDAKMSGDCDGFCWYE